MTRPAVPREAATVVLMRDREADGLPEVLMLQRHARDAFSANAYVFPGGMLEPADHSPLAVALSPGLTVAEAHRRMPDVQPPEKALGYAVAAIRETFEEARVLLARPAGGGTAPVPGGGLTAAREALHAGELTFLDWIADRGLCLTPEKLVYFAHWITPEANPIRFTARFFITAAPPGAEAQSDQREVTRHVWLTPAEALRRYEAGRIKLVNATLKNLEWLATFASTDAALAGLSTHTVRTILPKHVTLPDGSSKTLLPGDPGYDAA